MIGVAIRFRHFLLIFGENVPLLELEPYIWGPMVHFRRKPLMNLEIFETVHSLMKYTKVIAAAKLICPCNTLRTWNSFARIDTGGEQHPNRTCKTSLLFAPVAVRVHAGCSALHSDKTKTVNTITY